MNHLPLVWDYVRHAPVRTIATGAAIALGVLLICTLRTLTAAIGWDQRSANSARLITRHAVSLAFRLPIADKDQIRAIPGVRDVSTVNWFGGLLPARRQDQRAGGAGDLTDFFPTYAVDADEYLAIYPEIIVSADTRRAFLGDRRGAVVGRGLAARFGWKPGDVFHLESFLPAYRRSGGPFEFVVSGIYDTDEVRYPGTDSNQMFFRYDYLQESLGRSPGASTLAIAVNDPADAVRVAERIDAQFENSEAQTRTETESAYRAEMVSLGGSLEPLLNGIGAVVAVALLLVAANAMGMAMRERRRHVAVLKTLGFSRQRLVALAVVESSGTALVGAVVGLSFSRVMIDALARAPYLGPAVRAYPHLQLSPRAALEGLLIALVLGIVAGFVPSWFATRVGVAKILQEA